MPQISTLSIVYHLCQIKARLWMHFIATHQTHGFLIWNNSKVKSNQTGNQKDNNHGAPEFWCILGYNFQMSEGATSCSDDFLLSGRWRPLCPTDVFSEICHPSKAKVKTLYELLTVSLSTMKRVLYSRRLKDLSRGWSHNSESNKMAHYSWQIHSATLRP